MKKSFSLYLAIFILTLVVLVIFTNVFSVKTIKVEGVNSILGAESIYGKFLPLLNEDGISDDLKRENPKLASILVYKKYPNEIFISARLLRPVAVLELADGFIIIGENGKVLSKHRTYDNENLPKIQYYQKLFFDQYGVGETLEVNEIISAAQFSDKLLDLGIVVSSIDITNENMIVLHTEELEILITSSKDIVQQYRDFEYTYRQLKIKGQEHTGIDVRFEKPIIKTKTD